MSTTLAMSKKTKPSTDTTEAKALLAQRELARRRLLPFILLFEPAYQAGWVHKDICSKLEEFTQGIVDKKSPRLMLSMPPRHGKSLIASTYFPAWFMGNHPDLEIIATSYSSSLASKFSRSVRHQFREPQFEKLFPKSKLDPDAQSIDNWYTTKGGSYTAAGVGGGITGRGAHCLIIDDPVKNAEDAESETFRENLFEWFQSTAYTRLAPGGGVIIIQTRWHHDDLAGRLEEMSDKGDGDTYINIKYPAIAVDDEEFRKKDEPLHEERYPVSSLKMIQRAVGPRTWSALYQQRPTADTGSYFKREWLKFYTQTPSVEQLTIYSAWDLAIGKKEHNDYTVGIVVGVDRNEDLWVMDLVRGRWDSMEIVDKVMEVYQRWRPVINLIEKSHIEMSIGPYLEKAKIEQDCPEAYFHALPTGRRDKQARARSIQGRLQEGRVYLPKEASFTSDLLLEMMSFPYGSHDDQVDALAWIGLYLTEFYTQGIPKRKRKLSWRDNLQKFVKKTEATYTGRSAMSA